MTVYTVSSTDMLMNDSDSRFVLGSFTSRGKAVDACVAYVMERVAARGDFARAVLFDENRPDEMRGFMCEGRDGAVKVRRGRRRALERFLRDEIGGNGCYHVYADGDSFWFDVEENELSGPAWLMVTWGDKDSDDPDFARPFPELFESAEAAVANASRYASDLIDEICDESARRTKEADLAELRARLLGGGEARLDLDDGTAVHWVLYGIHMEKGHTDG